MRGVTHRFRLYAHLNAKVLSIRPTKGFIALAAYGCNARAAHGKRLARRTKTSFCGTT